MVFARNLLLQHRLLKNYRPSTVEAVFCNRRDRRPLLTGPQSAVAFHGIWKRCVHENVTRDENLDSKKKESHYDVIISGGGMVGSSLAAALGNEPSFKNKKVLLLEEGPHKKMEKLPKEFNSRVCALSPATKNFLSSFNAWSGIEKRRFQAVKRMQVWDSCSDSMITFNQDSMEDDLAYIAENDVILTAITEQLEHLKDSNVEIRYQTNVKSYKLPASNSEAVDQLNPANWAQVHLGNGQILSCKLLIGADGFKSLLRETAKIHSVNLEYDQLAVVATLKLPEDTLNNVAWQRFLPTGPIALLPLSNDASCLIWTTTVENGRSLLKLSNESFVDAVNNSLWSDSSKNSLASYVTQCIEIVATTVGLGETIKQLPPTILTTVEGSRMSFPLGLMHATHYVKPRMALIGDAAHRIHPLAGQGVNLGFGDVTSLTKILSAAAYNGTDIGSLRHLLEYETERQRQVIPIMAAVDCINRLYSTSFAPIVLLRSIGCQATNSLHPIKDQMIKFATN